MPPVCVLFTLVMAGRDDMIQGSALFAKASSLFSAPGDPRRTAVPLTGPDNTIRGDISSVLNVAKSRYDPHCHSILTIGSP